MLLYIWRLNSVSGSVSNNVYFHTGHHSVHIVGLGNPGQKYRGTRHNVGFDVIDAIAAKYDFSPWRARGECEVCEGSLVGVKSVLVKPQGYMNCSGVSLATAVKKIDLCGIDFRKLDTNASGGSSNAGAELSLVVIQDELDLLPGIVRVKLGGSDGGHKGVKDIARQYGTAGFIRVRVGIGHPRRCGGNCDTGSGARDCDSVDVSTYVLSRPRGQEEVEAFSRGVEVAIEAIIVLLEKGLDECQKLVNCRRAV